MRRGAHWGRHTPNCRVEVIIGRSAVVSAGLWGRWACDDDCAGQGNNRSLCWHALGGLGPALRGRPILRANRLPAVCRPVCSPAHPQRLDLAEGEWAAERWCACNGPEVEPHQRRPLRALCRESAYHCCTASVMTVSVVSSGGWYLRRSLLPCFAVLEVATVPLHLGIGALPPRKRPPPPPYKLRPCPSCSRCKDRNNFIRNLITYKM